DADDRWRPTMLAQQLRLLQAAPDAVFSFSNFVRFQHATGELMRDQFSLYPELARLPTQPLLQGEGHLILADAFDTLVGFGEVPAFTQVMMFRTQALQELAFDESLRICEDMDFVLRVALRGRTAYTAQILAEVRRHDSNVTAQFSMMALDKLQALRQLASAVDSQQHLLPYR